MFNTDLVRFQLVNVFEKIVRDVLHQIYLGLRGYLLFLFHCVVDFGCCHCAGRAGRVWRGHYALTEFGDGGGDAAG
jgi:hypothetical protein